MKKKPDRSSDVRAQESLTEAEMAKIAQIESILKSRGSLPEINVGTGLTKQSRLALPTETQGMDPHVQVRVENLWKELPPASPTDFHPTTLMTALKWAMGIIECRDNEPAREKENEIWYAESIVQLYRHLKTLEKLLSDKSVLELAWTDGLIASFQIGDLFREAMFKFEHERDALSGSKCRTGADNSRKAQAEQWRISRDPILGQMRAYVEEGKTIKNAARLTHSVHGMGKSTEANRKLWTRHNPSSTL